MYIKEIESYLRQNNVYITASVNGTDCYIGSFQGIESDDQGNLVIEATINTQGSNTDTRTTAKKYEFTGDAIQDHGRVLHKIRAIKDFGNIKAGDVGGWIEKEENLSHEGNAWVYGSAKVFGDAWVYGSAIVSENAEVFGNARVSGNAEVFRNARVYEDAKVYGSAKVFGDAWVYGSAWVYRNTQVYGNAEVFGNARVYGNAEVFGNARVYGDAKVSDNAEVFGDAKVSDNAKVSGDAWVCDKHVTSNNITLSDDTDSYTTELTGKELACRILHDEYFITDDSVIERVLSTLTDAILSDESLMRLAIKTSLNAMAQYPVPNKL